MSLYEQLLEKLDGREYGHYFSAFCPFDEHKTPALLVFDDGLAKCLSCNKVWSHETLAKKIGTSVQVTQSQPSGRILPRWYAWEEKYGDLNGIAQYAHETLKRYPKKWFKERQIEKYVEVGNLGFLDGWATFPVRNESGELLDIVVRAIKGKGDTRYVVSPVLSDSSRPLYVPNWKRVIEARTVYVVFGMIDAIALELMGLPCVTGITGKAVPVDKLQELNKRFIILPDKGEEEDAHKLANAYGMGARVKTLMFPPDTKDPDDIRIKYGNDVLLQMIGI